MTFYLFYENISYHTTLTECPVLHT